MEESRISICSFRKDLYQNLIPKFYSLFGKELNPIKTPMSEVIQEYLSGVWSDIRGVVNFSDINKYIIYFYDAIHNPG